MLFQKTAPARGLNSLCKQLETTDWKYLKLFFLFSFIFLYNSVGLGQEKRKDNRRNAIDAILVHLANCDIRNKFVSKPDSLPFHVETLIYSPSSGDLGELNSSEIIEWNGSSASALIRASRFGICVTAVDNLVVQLTQEGKWHVLQGLDWGLVVNNDSNNPLSFHGSRKVNSDRIIVKPFEFMHSRVAINNRLPYKFSPSTRNVRFQLNNDKGELSLVLRTPSDQERFGYPLEALWIFEEKKSLISGGTRKLTFCINSFAVGEEVSLLMRHPGNLKLYDRFFPEQSYVVDQNWKNKKYVDKLRTKDQVIRSRQMYKLVNNIDLNSIEKSNHCFQVKETAEMIRALMAYGSENMPKSKDQTIISYDRCLQKCDLAIEVLKNLTLQSHIQKENQFVAVQDQFMRWKYLESIYGPTTISELYDEIVELFFFQNPPNKERLFLLHESIADLGFPRHTGGGGKVNKTREIAFIDALYRSRSGLVEWAKIHRDEMLSADKIMLSAKKNTTNKKYLPLANVVVESLLRMNKTELIQLENLEEWFQSEIVNKKSNERFMNLSILTLQPSGRQYLLKKLKALQLNSDLRRDIINHLDVRLKATIQTKRYDFIPIEECNRIKKIIGDKT